MVICRLVSSAHIRNIMFHIFYHITVHINVILYLKILYSRYIIWMIKLIGRIDYNLYTSNKLPYYSCLYDFIAVQKTG